MILYQPFSSAVRDILPHAKAARQLQVICDSPLRAASHEGRSPCLIQAAIGQASHQTSFGNCGISHAKMERIGWNWYQLVSISKCPPWPTKVYQSAAGMSQNTVPTGTWCLRLDQLRPLMILCQSARGMLGYARHCSPGRKWCCAMLCNCFSSGEILQILEIPDFCVCRRLVAIPCDPFNQIQTHLLDSYTLWFHVTKGKLGSGDHDVSEFGALFRPAAEPWGQGGVAIRGSQPAACADHLRQEFQLFSCNPFVKVWLKNARDAPTHSVTHSLYASILF